MKRLTSILAVLLELNLTVSTCSPSDNKLDASETERPDKSTFTHDAESCITGKMLIIYYSFANKSHLSVVTVSKT